MHKKQLLCKQRHADRGLTPHRWQHLAPHLLLLAKQLPLRGAVQQLVASEGDREEVRRFVEDPPLAGEPRLPRLQDYWPPPAPEPAEEAAPGSAAGMGAADSAAGAAAGVAAGAAAAPPQPPAAVGRQAAGKAAGGSQGSAGAPAAKVAAATHAAGSLGEAVIDLTLSDSEDEGTQVGGAGVIADQHAALSCDAASGLGVRHALVRVAHCWLHCGCRCGILLTALRSSDVARC